MQPARRADLVARTVDDEIVILDRTSGHVHRLNATATCIWNHCDGKNTPDQIAGHLARAFARSADDVLPDVLAAIADMRRLGLLVP